MRQARANTNHQPMRRQTACRLTVRLTWDVVMDDSHPRETYGCVEDIDMARTMAEYAAKSAPIGIRRLTKVETSPSGGRFHPWTPLDLAEIFGTEDE